MMYDVCLFFTVLYVCLRQVIDGTVLCVHGGLSPDIVAIDQIRLLERTQEIPHDGPFCGVCMCVLVWCMVYVCVYVLTCICMFVCVCVCMCVNICVCVQT